jgi:erythromycin esterase-like protein
MVTTTWGEPGTVKQVRPALQGSFERLFHNAGISRFLLPLYNDPFKVSMLERAIGVQCLPETERRSHYFNARLRDQFDAIIPIDETTAVEPVTVAAIGTESLAA